MVIDATSIELPKWGRRIVTETLRTISLADELVSHQTPLHISVIIPDEMAEVPRAVWMSHLSTNKPGTVQGKSLADISDRYRPGHGGKRSVMTTYFFVRDSDAEAA